MKTQRRSIVLAVMTLALMLTSTAHAVLDPNVGRFISRDPSGYSDGPNEYQYVQCNPISFGDPSGLITSSSSMVFSVTDLGHRPPVPIQTDPVTKQPTLYKHGQAFPTKWDIQSKYDNIGGCLCNDCWLSVDGEAHVDFWWSTEQDMPNRNFTKTWNSYPHEWGHVEIYRENWLSLTKEVFNYVGVDLPCKKVKCYVSLIEKLRQRYALMTIIQNNEYDVSEYGGLPGIAESIPIDKARLAKLDAEIKTKKTECGKRK